MQFQFETNNNLLFKKTFSNKPSFIFINKKTTYSNNTNEFILAND